MRHMTKLFTVIFYVAMCILGGTLLLATVHIANAQGMPHDSLETIMSQTNPLCYVRGTVDRDEFHSLDNEIKILRVDEIEPQFHAWADICRGLEAFDFTELVVSELSGHPRGQSLTITCILVNGVWTVYHVSRWFSGV